MSKEDFKSFVRIHPELAGVVRNNNTSWQDLYDFYDLYGEKSNVWDNYLVKNTTNTTKVKEATTDLGIADLLTMVKSIDLKSVQKTVGNLQKTIGLLQDLGVGAGKSSATKVNSYEPRPLYKYFDD